METKYNVYIYVYIGWLWKSLYKYSFMCALVWKGRRKIAWLRLPSDLLVALKRGENLLEYIYMLLFNITFLGGSNLGLSILAAFFSCM
jgi:hypothetical protein